MARVLEEELMKKVLASCVLAFSLSAGLFGCAIEEEVLPEEADYEQNERNYCWYQYLECLHWASSAEDEYWCDVAYYDCMGY
jgi:hypothetical protein